MDNLLTLGDLGPLSIDIQTGSGTAFDTTIKVDGQTIGNVTHLVYELGVDMPLGKLTLTAEVVPLALVGQADVTVTAEP